MEIIKQIIKTLQPEGNNDQCSCKRLNMNAESYCDNIEIFLNMTKTNKNFYNEKAKKLYEVTCYNYRI
jgi:hypothetical protein